MLGEWDVGVFTGDGEAPGIERQEPRDLPEQAGLASAVRPGDQQGLAGLKREAQALEEHPPAAPAANVMGSEADRFRHLLGIRASCGRERQAAAKSAALALFASLSRCRKRFYIDEEHASLKPGCRSAARRTSSHRMIGRALASVVGMRARKET
jgi:hypothetical protein